MTVSTYNPNTTMPAESPVNFTPSAIKHLTKQVANQRAKGIEFKIKESGCSGFKYLLELAQEVSEDATSYSISESLSLFVSPKAIPMIKGTVIDFVQEGVNFHLTFNNPNATASCGCGESFSVNPQD